MLRKGLRITKDTELGSNDTIKNPKPIPSQSKRGRTNSESYVAHEIRTSMFVTLIFSCTDQHAVLEEDPSPDLLTTDIVATSSEAGRGSEKFRLNFSQLKRAHAQRVLPTVREEDLKEKFVRGASVCGAGSLNRLTRSLVISYGPSPQLRETGSGPVCILYYYKKINKPFNALFFRLT